MTRGLCTSLLLLLAGAGVIVAGDEPQPALVLDAGRRTAVIEAIVRQLHESYHSAEAAEVMEQRLRQRRAEGAYDRITDPVLFAETLTADLREVSRDAHLSVNFSPRPALAAPASPPTAEERARAREREREVGASRMFGFRRVERLDWNVGYIDLRGFYPAALAGEAAASAMSLVGDTAALIIDLRNNTGGEADMVPWLMSYFFDEPVLTGTIYVRSGDRLRQYWTSPSVPGRKYLGRSVYLLTSARTISAAEAFAYSLQAHRRAQVVGEVTAGAANPGGIQRLDDDFTIWMPRGRVSHPVTNANWEGSGVQPDIDVSSELALHAAHIAALQVIAGGTSDAEWVAGLNRTIERLREEMSTSTGRGTSVPR